MSAFLPHQVPTRKDRSGSTHEVAALQPAARGREPRAGSRWRNSDSGVATINSRIVGVRARSRTAGSSAASSLSHGEPHRPGLQRDDKNGLDQSRKTNLLECAVGISAHKKLIHTMPRKADRPTTRATVVGWAICTMSNYLKLHAPTKLNPLLAKIAPLLNSSTCSEAATLRIS